MDGTSHNHRTNSERQKKVDPFSRIDALFHEKALNDHDLPPSRIAWMDIESRLFLDAGFSWHQLSAGKSHLFK